MYLTLISKPVVFITADPMLASGVCRCRNGGGADPARDDVCGVGANSHLYYTAELGSKSGVLRV